MRLYHFTSDRHLPLILAHGGLAKGDVMVGEDGEGTVTATWLSTDPHPGHQGLPDGTGTIPTPPELIARGLPAVLRPIDKRTARITVVIPSTDRNLRRWHPFAKGRLGRRLIDHYLRQAGDPRHAENWWFYRGLIPLERFVRVEIRGGDGEYRTATPEQLAALKPFDVAWTGGVPEADWEH